MQDTNSIFNNPATDPCGVLFHVIKIFIKQWSTFLSLAFLQATSLFAAISVASIIIGSFFFFVAIRNSGFDGSLAYGVIIPLLILIVASSIAVGWVWCIYTGAMIRAAVEICAGGAPSACPTVTIASKQGFNMIGFQFLFGLLLCGSAFIVKMVLNWLGGGDDDDDADDFYPDALSAYTLFQSSSPPSSSAGTIFLVCLLYALFVFIANIVMIGAIPTIVVEDKSSCSALLRSWKLCKQSICLIFLSVTSVNLLNTFLCFIFYAVVTATVDRLYALVFAGAFVYHMVILPISMITAAVLYLTLRVRFEGLTQSELSEALSLTRPEPSAPLATDDDDDDNDKPSAPLVIDDDMVTPLLHAELVTEVV